MVRFALLPWIREYCQAARGTPLVRTVLLRRPIVGHRAQSTDKLWNIEDMAGVSPRNWRDWGGVALYRALPGSLALCWSARR